MRSSVSQLGFLRCRGQQVAHVQEALPQDVGKLVRVRVTAHVESCDGKVQSGVLRVIAAAVAVRDRRSEAHHCIMLCSHLQTTDINVTFWLVGLLGYFLTVVYSAGTVTCRNTRQFIDCHKTVIRLNHAHTSKHTHTLSTHTLHRRT